MITLSVLPRLPTRYPQQPSPKASISSPVKLPPSSSLKSAKHSFELLKDRLIQSTDAGHLREAISTLDHMTVHGITPDPLCYTVLLKSCIRSRQFQLGKLVHAKMKHPHIQLDLVVQNALISLYSKCGDWVTANEIFVSMGDQRNLVSWSSMISCFANNKMESQAVVTFVRMLEFGCYPNEYTFAAVIRACSNDENALFGRTIFGFILKNGYLHSDVCVGCALIDFFAKGCCDLDSAHKVFDEMPVKNAVTWTLLITRFVQLGQPRAAADLYFDMGLNGHVPDGYTFSAAVSASVELGSLSLGQQLHSQVIRSGLAVDVCVGCSLVGMYAKCLPDVYVDESRKVFDQMTDHNVMSWTAIITAYVQSGGHDKDAIDLFCKMITGQVQPNHFTFASVLKACGNIAHPLLGQQVHAHAVKAGFGLVSCVGNSLISMHAQCGKMENARKAFDVLFEKNLVSYNAMVDGYAKNPSSEGVFEFLNEIEGNTGIAFDAFTFASLLSGAASLGAISEGERIHARLIKLGFGSDICICNALISMYSRCGDMEAASAVFDVMGIRNFISWTSIITSLAKHGSAQQALEMFRRMIEAGAKPNEITFIAVLSACSHAGMIPEGRKHFKSMQNEHGVVPRMEHYACMVDLLGRRGFLNEALDFINSMPVKADVLVWRTLLGACRVHRDSWLGEHAAKMILEQDPHDPAAYVLLSNLHASVGQWEDMVKIRKSMKERKVTKEAGCSWMEIENRVHRFYVGDTLHPQAREIYEELDRLVQRIKQMGYVPDTDFVLHDVEDEQKERYLLQHSEKIAVAFGIISTSRSKPIRIFKNLRVCGDCHTAIKYISLATGRKIVVRDSNRFHHIENGVCSCNEYW